MSVSLPRYLTSKTGAAFLIREAEVSDAAAMIDYVQTVAGETNFLTFGPGEFGITLKDEERLIKTYRQTDNQVFFLAEMENRIAGMLHVGASQKPRLRHIGEFGITVRKECWDLGIGAALMQCMLDWALHTGVIRKINLVVQVDNTKAIQLYKKFGFEMEGRRRRDLFIDGVFYDAYIMGKLID